MKKKRIWSYVVATLLVFLLITPAAAQGKLNVGFRPSVNFPVKELGGSELKKGSGFEATITYHPTSILGVYAGWGWNIFHPIESDGETAHFEETGYRFGLRLTQPLSRESKLTVQLSAGGVMNHIETEDKDGDIIDDTGHGLGWEAEACLAVPLNDRWHIVPGVRYHALNRELSFGTMQESVDLNYVSVGVAVTWILVHD